MKKEEYLKNGTKVVIRSFTKSDLNALMRFYAGLPPSDRRYLKVDVTSREAVKRRMKQIEQGTLFRHIALAGKEVVGDGSLELTRDDWRKHQGELRVIISRTFRRKGLGMIMMRELYFLAASKKVQTVVAKLLRPQEGARKICRKLGFHEEAFLPDYVHDQKGASQDMLIMTADMKELWEELEHFYHQTDWQRCK